jgi:hypothetical protein
MATVDFKPFATDPGANVISQAVYAAMTTLLADGFLSGTAVSNQVNKVFRQSTLMAAVLATFISDITGQDTLDDGTTATLISNLMASVLKAGYATDSGVVNAYAITLSPAPLAYYVGMVVGFKTANTNTLTNPTLNVNGLGAVTLTEQNGAVLFVNQLPANSVVWATYNSTGPRFELLNSTFSTHATLADNATNSAVAATLNTNEITVASSTTPDIFGAAGNTIDYTGTANCTGFAAAAQPGMTRTLICAGACQFTAGANLLIEGIVSGVTITLAANAICNVIALTTTKFKMTYTVSGTFTANLGGSIGPGTLPGSQYLVTNGRCFLHFASPNNQIIVNNDGTSNFNINNIPIQAQPFTLGYYQSPIVDATSGPSAGYAYAEFSSAGVLNFVWNHYTGTNTWSTTGSKAIAFSDAMYSMN